MRQNCRDDEAGCTWDDDGCVCHDEGQEEEEEVDDSNHLLACCHVHFTGCDLRQHDT